ncbi:putative magnesium/nickel/cobalt transporter [Magnetospirillum gryphiswaldense MSR-1 v2]|uniref:Magnesium transport protein CorA n=1 Tax=Magnetospirillum gryphiswaldense (strain DSM 6361 / JCM 21280 / NBRC 15271 / MSR-1) TaxID=431944 RepID=V6EZ64_MAGGM|nr:magnesium transporter CorA family protein [Magnetospirillum gryphiswaldense]CDK98550.1 putative magnesium/nickel/cobalt transporter [Magnetospirillum gryphiswaldense MSR-1 v2]
MLTVFYLDQGLLCQDVVQGGGGGGLPPSTVWIDLLSPTRDEERLVEVWTEIEVPTREEMQEIELSSRLYVEGRAMVMTMPIINKATTEAPESAAITFIIVDGRMITVRYVDPVPFSMFIRRISRNPAMIADGEKALMGLLEQIADRLADILEGATADLEALSRQVFVSADDQPRGSKDLRRILQNVGRTGDLATRAKDSLLGLNRLLLFLSAQASFKKDARSRIKTLMRDATSIAEHANFLSSKVSFLLDATLGLINIEQNNIIKIFSVAAVAFLPPTLIASIYGMNFQVMPELGWRFGYLWAIGLMLLSAIVPLWYFRRRKWL